MRCETCEGTGHEGRGEDRRCLDCRGRGWMRCDWCCEAEAECIADDGYGAHPACAECAAVIAGLANEKSAAPAA